MISYWSIFLLVSVLARECTGLSSPYIEMPLIERESGIRDTGRLYLMLQSLKLGADFSPEDVLQVLREFSKNIGDNKWNKEDVGKLIGLADGGDRCGYGQYEVFLKALLTMERTKTIENPHVLLNFLEHYGRLKYSRCASKVSADFTTNSAKNKKDLSRIYKFFSKLMRIPKDCSNEFLLRRLQRFDLARSYVDVKGLTEISPRDPEGEWGVVTRVLVKLAGTCNHLVTSFGMDFNVLNLAAALDQSKDYFGDNIELKKLNEIHRICLESESNRSDVEEHFSRLAESQHL